MLMSPYARTARRRRCDAQASAHGRRLLETGVSDATHFLALSLHQSNHLLSVLRLPAQREQQHREADDVCERDVPAVFQPAAGGFRFGIER